ncbi:HhH-GPD superfamily base excision DNA repair protein [Geopyxis carbonaria]|nr:HhH-GPD superfamily base excision DNA repair protein [Geopyxis carbonaria]
MGDIPALPLPPAPAMVKKEPGRRFKKEPASDIKKEPAKRIKKELPVRIKSEAGIKSEASIKSEVPDATPLPGPENWERIYALVKRMRLSHPAPVDTMGCERLADATHSPKDQRFQTLIALMLSSQTKDTVTSALPGGLTLNSILSIPAAELNTLIHPVGFHTRKTGYIQAAAAILRDQHGGDIPDSVDGLMALPGVGPKMAHLCMGAAWDTVTGVGVDVHVHRIANMWGWATAKDPEGTRVQLEKWLPRDKWREINWLLVGFGQSICLPRGRRCGECELGVGEGKGLCRAAGEDYKPAKQKRRVRRKVVKEEVPIDGGDVGGGDIEDCLK